MPEPDRAASNDTVPEVDPFAVRQMHVPLTARTQNRDDEEVVAKETLVIYGPRDRIAVVMEYEGSKYGQARLRHSRPLVHEVWNTGVPQTKPRPHEVRDLWKLVWLAGRCAVVPRVAREQRRPRFTILDATDRDGLDELGMELVPRRQGNLCSPVRKEHQLEGLSRRRDLIAPMSYLVADASDTGTRHIAVIHNDPSCRRRPRREPSQAKEFFCPTISLLDNAPRRRASPGGCEPGNHRALSRRPLWTDAAHPLQSARLTWLSPDTSIS